MSQARILEMSLENHELSADAVACELSIATLVAWLRWCSRAFEAAMKRLRAIELVVSGWLARAMYTWR